MAARSLMARAKELLEKRAGVAMVIVPLAMAVPATADVISFAYDPGSSFVSQGSGGFFLGTVPSDAFSGSSITLTGTSIPPQGNPNNNYVTTGELVTGAQQPTNDPNSPQGLYPGLLFQWSGGVTTDGVPNNAIDVNFNVGFSGNSTQSINSMGQIYWTVQAWLDGDNSATHLETGNSPLLNGGNQLQLQWHAPLERSG